MVTKAQKENAVSTIKEQSEGASVAFVADFASLSVADLTDLRRSIREVGKCMVVKNTLAERALTGTEFENVKAYLTGPSLLVLGTGEAPSTIKAFLEFQKKLDPNLTLKGGVVSGDPNALDSKALKQIGDLPPKEVLLGQIAGSLTACPNTIVNSINQIIGSIGDLAVKIAEKQNNQ